MKILIVTADFYPSNSGFSNASLSLVDSINLNLKWQVYVFTTQAIGEQEEYSKANVIRHPYIVNNSAFINKIPIVNKIFYYLNKIYYYLNITNNISRLVSREGIDMILFETNNHTNIQDKILSKYPDKCLVRIHSTTDAESLIYFYDAKVKLSNVSWVTKIIYKRKQIKSLDFMKNIKYVTSTNRYHIEFIKQKIYMYNPYIVWDSKEYFVIPNSLEENFVNDYRTIFDGDYLLTLGKLSYNGFIQKGFRDLLKAILKLKTSGLLPSSFKLIMIGDGEYRKIIEKDIEDYRISDYIVMIAKTSRLETIDYIRKSKGIILASRYEGQSMFVTEALAVGKPVLITKDNGMIDMVEDKRNGYELQSGDYNQIGQSIVDFYELSSQNRIKMGNHSAFIYDTKFSQKQIASELNFISSLLKAKSTV